MLARSKGRVQSIEFAALHFKAPPIPFVIVDTSGYRLIDT